jgi:hypothetical protein
MIVTSAQGLVKKLDQIRGQILKSATLRLFKNDFTPLQSSVTADFVEANFSGYAAIPLVLADWSASYLNASQQAETDMLTKTFTQSAATVTNSIYGWYLTIASIGFLMADRDPTAPFLMNAAGKTYSVAINDLLGVLQ